MDYIHNNSIFVTASAVDLRTTHNYTVCGLRREVFLYLEWQGLNGKEFITSHLTLACFLIADLSKNHKRQQVKTGTGLANLLRHQRGQLVNIVLISKACTRIDL